MSEPDQLSLTDYAVLGLLAEQPRHGFAIAKELTASSRLGRVLTVRRPLVYRSLDHLVETGRAEPTVTEPGEAGPQRTIHRITSAGRRSLNKWLVTPVAHIRDLRIEFQLKLALAERLHRSPLRLVIAQRHALEPTLAALESANGSSVDHLELWRHHIASAAGAYLEHLESIYRVG